MATYTKDPKHIILNEEDTVSVVIDGVWHSKIVDKIILDQETNTCSVSFREIPQIKQKGWD